MNPKTQEALESISTGKMNQIQKQAGLLINGQVLI